MVANNRVCGVGVAFNAKIGGNDSYTTGDARISFLTVVVVKV